MTKSFLLAFACLSFVSLAADHHASYFPPSGNWQRKSPSEVGLDAAKLKDALAFAQSKDSGWDFEKDQVRVFGSPLGPVPKKRAATNGIILRHGYIVAEFGDTKAIDPVYSVAKSFLSTVCGLAVDRGLIRDVNDPVTKYIHDGGYESPQNKKVTWKNHLHQESEWEGSLWGKNADFIGHEAFGSAERKPRALQAPGSFYEYNDVRVNRFSLSLLRLFGRSLPSVLKSEIMDPIGASDTWKWVSYDNSKVDIGGKQIGSVSGGTRWGGGIWTNSEDMARFGLLILNHGKWDGRQLISEKWLREAVIPSEHGPDYGYLWLLNTKKKHPGPASSFAANGNGSNTIWIDPEHDIVFIWRWFDSKAVDPMVAKLMAAVTD